MGYVYILASKPYGTLYIGVTSDLVHRVSQHRRHALEGFTRRYGVAMLVWHGAGGSISGAIAREKQLKKWRRAWKIDLIESGNPQWRDLAEDFGFEPLAAVAARHGFPRSRE